jgi:hypothetical protein
MRRTLLWGSAFALGLGMGLLFPPFLHPQSFIKTQWYMTKQQVISIEGRNPVEEENNLISFPISIWDRPFTCTYGFTNNKLDAIYLSAGDDVMSQEALVGILRREYGSPVRIQDPVQRILSWPLPKGELLVFEDQGSPQFSLFPRR